MVKKSTIGLVIVGIVIVIGIFIYTINTSNTEKKTAYGKWQISAYQLDTQSAVSAWSDDMANALVGKTLTLSQSSIRLLGQRCAAKVQPPTANNRQVLNGTTVQNPCGDGQLRLSQSTSLFSLDWDDSCSQQQFPPYIAVLSRFQAIAFGDGIAFCLVHH